MHPPLIAITALYSVLCTVPSLSSIYRANTVPVHTDFQVHRPAQSFLYISARWKHGFKRAREREKNAFPQHGTEDSFNGSCAISISLRLQADLCILCITTSQQFAPGAPSFKESSDLLVFGLPKTPSFCTLSLVTAPPTLLLLFPLGVFFYPIPIHPQLSPLRQPPFSDAARLSNFSIGQPASIPEHQCVATALR